MRLTFDINSDNFDASITKEFNSAAQRVKTSNQLWHGMLHVCVHYSAVPANERQNWHFPQLR